MRDRVHTQVRLKIPVDDQRRHDVADELGTMRNLVVEAEGAYRRSERHQCKFLGREEFLDATSRAWELFAVWKSDSADAQTANLENCRSNVWALSRCA